MDDKPIVHMRSSGKLTGRGRSPRSAPNMEKMLAEIARIMEEKQFTTIDEANAFLDELMKSGDSFPARANPTPVEQAQDLIYDAWETGNRRNRVKLAREALAISQDCADAYVILAEDSARSPEKAMEYYLEGVKAGERALGTEKFEDLIGHFWGVTETRPYMRARAGLAYLLWETGRRHEAIDHYREMLRLNPSDNQGVRYHLLLCLITEGMYDKAEQLLRSYDEASAIWLYTHALLMYRRYGPSRKTTKQLIEAMEYNPHVPDYLLGRQRLPKGLPDYIGFGDDSEAIVYVSESAHLWRQQEGALEWLRETWDEHNSR